jgi:hypothetical protein
MPTCTNVIERIHRPAPIQFYEEFERPGIPVVLTGLMDDWSAMTAWSREYLKRRAGHRNVSIRSEAVGEFTITPEAGPRWKREEVTFAEFLTRLDAPEHGRVNYLQATCLEETLPELLGDIRIPVYADRARLTGCRLWIGPGQRVGLHYDLGQNLLAMIRGRKRLLLFDPAQLPYLYHSPIEGPNSSFPYSRLDPRNPDLARFPAFAHAQPIEVTIEPGEMLFMPSFWWHDVLSEGENIAVNFWWDLMGRTDQVATAQAFTQFQDMYRRLPWEWKDHIRRMTNEFIFGGNDSD